jgi:hypothetical protein
MYKPKTRRSGAMRDGGCVSDARATEAQSCLG